ncbi:MAG: carboxypeptidase-like regulatory domain-containing protein [Planctomycetota bacterium]
MSARGTAWIALGAVAGFLIWLVFAVGDRAEADRAIEEAPELVSEVEEEDPELEPAPYLEAEEEETARTFIPGEPIAPAEPAATAIPAPSPDSAFVRGFLRDSATGEPLPLYSLRIQGSAGPWEDVLTDEGGRFTTGSPMAGTTIRITPFDDPSHKRSLPVIAIERLVEEGDAPDLDLSVAAGPTYRLSITPANAVVPTTLEASLRLRNPDEVRNLGPARLRAGDPPWVRFAPVPGEFDRCDRIEVRDDEGLWFGSTKVSALRGVVPGFVEVVLDARAVLVGKVVDREGRPIARANLVLEGEADSGQTYVRKGATRDDGQFRFELLSGGSGTLTLRSLRHIGQVAALRLLGGAVTQQDFILAPHPAAGAIRGRLESETGRYESDVTVVLRPLSGKDLFENQKVRWEQQGGRLAGAFGFEALPAGEYEIAVRDGGWFAWNPQTLTASPPFESARFVVLDDVVHGDFSFRARDSETGENLDAFAWWSVRGGSSGSKRVPYDRSFLARLPLERSFRWRLDRPGYRPSFGDEKAFAVEEWRDGKLRKIAEVDLEPGWGEVYRVVHRNGRKPIAGVKILLDGREAGTTKPDGTCRVEAREKPRSVAIEYRDWKVASPVDMRPAWKRREKRFVEIQAAQPREN